MGISNKKLDGTPIVATGKLPVQTGITSKNTIEYFGRNVDIDGNIIPKQYRIVIKQANGATFTQVGYEPNVEWETAVNILNQQMMHICTRVITDDEFGSLCERANDDFDTFFQLVETEVLPLLQKAKWHVKIVLTENKKDGKYYPKLAKYPNFIELDDNTPSTTISDSLAKGETYAPIYNSAPKEEAPQKKDDPFL